MNSFINWYFVCGQNICLVHQFIKTKLPLWISDRAQHKHRATCQVGRIKQSTLSEKPNKSSPVAWSQKQLPLSSTSIIKKKHMSQSPSYIGSANPNAAIPPRKAYWFFATCPSKDPHRYNQTSWIRIRIQIPNCPDLAICRDFKRQRLFLFSTRWIGKLTETTGRFWLFRLFIPAPTSLRPRWFLPLSVFLKT